MKKSSKKHRRASAQDSRAAAPAKAGRVPVAASASPPNIPEPAAVAVTIREPLLNTQTAVPPMPQHASVQQPSQPERFRSVPAVFSTLLLLLSLVVVTCTDTVLALRTKLRDFYAAHLHHRLRGVRAASEHIRASRVLSILCITALVVLLPMSLTMRTGVRVIVNGKVLGYAQSQSSVSEACTQIEQMASEASGKPYKLNADITYRFAIVPNDAFLPSADLPEKIAGSVDSLTTLAVLKVNGNLLGACSSSEQIQQVLDRIAARYTKGNPNAQVHFLQSITVDSLQAPVALLQTPEQLYRTLTTTTLPAKTYTANEKDTLSSIAVKNGMRTSALLTLNPSIVPERMTPGTKVVLKAASPLLSVEVKKVLDYTEKIPFETVKQENAQLLENKQQVVRSGVPGQATVSAEVTTVNGVETKRTILSRKILSNATDAIIDIGTKPSDIGTGTLISPIAGGSITSGYKMRWGHMHKGVDFGASTGTPVRAADNGRVILATNNGNGYGNYIIIDHGNGMKTLYGHNSKLLVQVGDVVQKGQTIAYSGNTGNSTGPHCHFEVMLHNENVNPADYV